MKKKRFGFLMLWQRTVLLIIGYSVAIIVLISAIVLGVITLIRDDDYAVALFNFFWMLTGAGILFIFLKGVISLILCIANCRFTFKKCKIDRQDVSKQLDYFISRSFSKTNFVGEYYIKCSTENKNSIKLITKVLMRHINKVFGWLKLLDYVGYIITFDNNDCDISFIDKILKKQKAFFVFVGIENIDKQKQAKIHAWMSSSNDVVSYFVINDDSNQALMVQSYGRYFLCETEGKEANKTEVNNDFDISDYWDNYFLNCEIAFHKYKSYFDENPNNPFIAFVYGITCFELDKHDIAPNVYECSEKTDDIVLKERLQIVYVMLTHGNAIKLAEIETNDILSKCVRNPVNALCARHMAEHLRLEKGDFASNKGSLLEDYLKTINDMMELNKKTLSKNDRYFLLYNLKHAISDYLRLLFIHDGDRSESRCLVNNFFGYLSDTDYGKNHSKDIDQFKEYYIDINILLYEDYKSRCKT